MFQAWSRMARFDFTEDQRGRLMMGGLESLRLFYPIHSVNVLRCPLRDHAFTFPVVLNAWKWMRFGYFMYTCIPALNISLHYSTRSLFPSSLTSTILILSRKPDMPLRDPTRWRRALTTAQDRSQHTTL